MTKGFEYNWKFASGDKVKCYVDDVTWRTGIVVGREVTDEGLMYRIFLRGMMEGAEITLYEKNVMEEFYVYDGKAWENN